MSPRREYAYLASCEGAIGSKRWGAPTKAKLGANSQPLKSRPEDGQTGVQGAVPPPRGLGGCAPRIKQGGELPTLATPPRVGPKTPANPQPTGVGKWEARGAKPPWQGAVGGVPPQNQKKGRVAHISNPATSGTQNAGEPSASEGGQNGGPGGQSPHGGGSGGCAPTKP